MVVTGIVAWRMDSLFTISPEWSWTARRLLIVVGAGTALGIPLGLFGGVLEGFQHFTWVGIIQGIATLIRAGIVVYVLNHGAGLLAVGVITVAFNLLASLVFVGVAFRLYRGLRLHLNLVHLSTLRTLASFGVVTFWMSIAMVLRFSFDSMVIATFISLQAVTLFAISAKLVSYVTDGVQVMAQIFTPMSSMLDASGDRQGLRRVLVVSNRYSAFLILPMAGVLIFTGASILRVWVGPSYAAISYGVLVILTIPTTLYLAQAGSPKILFGMARHKTLAVVMLIEGVANLGLSILLARWYGINGVALGTAIPLAATCIFFLPQHLCKQLDLPVREFLFEAYFYPLVCSAPAWLTLWALNRWIQPASWQSLICVLAAGGVVYGVAFGAYFYWVERNTTAGVGRTSYALGG
jgi:O-antigen/teichoic acid export membrane protein